MNLAAQKRRPIVGGNWKMNTVLSSAAELAEDLVRRIGEETDVDVVLCPPFPNLETVHRIIAGSTVQLGAQNAFWQDAGAFTGEVSVPMLIEVGCEWVIVGHSERRHILGETNEIVNSKLHAVLHHGLNAILAVGETLDERRSGNMGKVLESQLQESLAGVRIEDMARVVVAYEPVWAIGTGETASPEQARDAHAFCRSVLGSLYGEEIAAATRIQYGGSVTGSNCSRILGEPGIDGALVGGASLKPDDFARIVAASRR